MHLPSLMVRRANRAGWADDLSEQFKWDEINPWTRAKLQECCYEVRQGDDHRKIIVQQTLQKGKDLWRRIVVPASPWAGRGHTVERVPSLPPLSA